MTLVLASQSEARRALLSGAGVPFDVMAAHVDEAAAKGSFRAGDTGARDLADALAELKAVRVSARRPGDLVLGCDQTLALDDGSMLDKPADRAEAAAQLERLSGSTHRLFSALVIAENGRPVWRHVDQAKLTMRRLSRASIDAYLDTEYPAIAGCVGCYRVEGRGIQLFARIEGSHFTILGLPLLPLLDYLRVRGVLPS